MTAMYKTIGSGIIAAAAIAVASPAAALSVDYTGLAFNSQSGSFSFSRITDEASQLPFGGLSLDQAGTPEDGLGQTVYTVNGGTAIDSVGGLNGATIDFGPSTKAITFGGGSVEMFITGGQFQIKNNDTANTPTVALPFGLGSASPHYELENGFLNVTMNGVAMTFQLCESTSGSNSCSLSGNDRPWGANQPYNTLNVGDNGGETDLAMFVYLRGECDDDDCPFYDTWTTTEWTGSYIYDFWYKSSGQWIHKTGFGSCPSDNKFNGKTIYKSRNDSWSNKGCNKEKEYETVTHKDTDIYMKLALWGQSPRDPSVAEPATLSLLGLGLIGLAAARRRRKAA